MQRWIGTLGILVLAMSLLTITPAQAETNEFRAVWIDAFGAGIYDEAEIDQLIADVKAANMNAIVAQVGRRGDCFCNKAIMPRTQANIAPEPFDPLETLIERAHAEGIEVHAWVIATAIWNSDTPPIAENHVFNTNGLSADGDDNWLLVRSDGEVRGGLDYYLDPGHPDAADYIVSMYTSIIENYDVDGINMDRIRYPDFNLEPNVSAWGYNPVAVQRFHEATDRTDVPEPSDAEWSQWRRDQITNIVRRVYLESYAIDPQVKISADTITYGYGPETQGGWENSRTYAEVLQDWRSWMEEGILDINMPMNYKREHFVDEPNNQLRMYEEWNTFAKDHQFDRQAVIGSALYLNFIEGSVDQVRKALEPSDNGNSAVGWVGYSYRTPDVGTLTGERTGEEGRAELIRALTEPSEYDDVVSPVFADTASIPAMPWKDAPTQGHLRGIVQDRDGTAVDQMQVQIYALPERELVDTRITDGSGWFGFVDLEPGRYLVRVAEKESARGGTAFVQIEAGALASVELSAFQGR
ncbi:MAG: family 10 glycosylhydrolase [Chloroflexota bacterium]